ncbi:MAG: molybdopterin molybdenumtransferase MoeA, partial [Longispora sp.]|nr:molybdopterin molybdenumtransferase MoeA [Longispora sp. (in: high G+C Gram-positive bacteria)]
MTQTAELMPLADYLYGVMSQLRPLPPLEVDLTGAYGNVLAEDVAAPGPLPAFDHASIDGYA